MVKQNFSRWFCVSDRSIHLHQISRNAIKMRFCRATADYRSRWMRCINWVWNRKLNVVGTRHWLGPFYSAVGISACSMFIDRFTASTGLKRERNWLSSQCFPNLLLNSFINIFSIFNTSLHEPRWTNENYFCIRFSRHERYSCWLWLQ